jgi:hypothetical protein
MAYTEHEKEVLRKAGLGHIVDAAENTVRPGELKMITRHDQTGRPIFEFKGDKSTWMDQFKAQPQLQLFISNGSFNAQQAMEKKNAMVADMLKRVTK